MGNEALANMERVRWLAELRPQKLLTADVREGTEEIPVNRFE